MTSANAGPKLRRPEPSVVVAIPTIKARDNAWEVCAEHWQRFTCQPVTVIPSWAKGGWGAGLNEVWEQVKGDPPDVFVCSSDDMYPADDNWLPPLLRHLVNGAYPAPTVEDPRFTNYGGHRKLVPDGTPSHMSTLPVLAGEWGNTVFPLPPGLSYYADNLIAVKLGMHGIECVAVPSSRIVHGHDPRGRGFGHGTETKAMMAHSRLYSAELKVLGVDRRRLHPNLRGAYWQS
jgi:glycosyl transferase family 2